MFLKRLITLIPIVLLPSMGLAEQACPSLSERQLNTLQFSYDLGKARDMGWSLAAIAFQESSAGLFRLNLAGPAFGTYQILLSSAAKRMGVTTPFDKNRLAQDLLYDDTLGATLAMEELSFWLRSHQGSWQKTWASYYAGYNVSAGLEYSENIVGHIRMLRGCGFIITEEDNNE